MSQTPNTRHTCPDLGTWSSYVDGSVDTRQLEKLKAHLQTCDHCFGKVSSLMLSLGRDEERPSPESQIVEATATSKQRRATAVELELLRESADLPLDFTPPDLLSRARNLPLPPRRRAQRWPLYGAAAGLMLAVVTGLYMGKQYSMDPAKQSAMLPYKEFEEQLEEQFEMAAIETEEALPSNESAVLPYEEEIEIESVSLDIEEATLRSTPPANESAVFSEEPLAEDALDIEEAPPPLLRGAAAYSKIKVESAAAFGAPAARPSQKPTLGRAQLKDALSSSDQIQKESTDLILAEAGEGAVKTTPSLTESRQTRAAIQKRKVARPLAATLNTEPTYQALSRLETAPMSMMLEARPSPLPTAQSEQATLLLGADLAQVSHLLEVGADNQEVLAKVRDLRSRAAALAGSPDAVPALDSLAQRLAAATAPGAQLLDWWRRAHDAMAARIKGEKPAAYFACGRWLKEVELACRAAANKGTEVDFAAQIHSGHQLLARLREAQAAPDLVDSLAQLNKNMQNISDPHSIDQILDRLQRITVREEPTR